MSEFVDYAIRGDDTSDAGPSLSLIGNTPCIAWKGSGSQNRWANIMPIGRNPDGSVWFDTSRKLTFDGGTEVGGGIALGQYERDQGALMWSLDHEPASLVGNTVDENIAVTNDLVALGQSSQYAPALCWWIRELNMAWTGEDQRLNVAPLGFSDSGWEFLFERKSTSDETSEYEPALAWRPAPNRLYMAWTGEGDGELNVMYCQGGAYTDPQPHLAVFPSSTKKVFRGETSEAGPSVHVVGSVLTLVYRGSGNNNINVLEVDVDNNYEVIRKRTSGHTTPHKPAYASFWDRKWVAYTGDDSHLYLARVAP